MIERAMPKPTPGELYVKAMAATRRYIDGVVPIVR